MPFRQLLFLCFILLISPFGKILAQPYTKFEKRIIRSIYKESGIEVKKVPNLLVIYESNDKKGHIQLDFNPTDSITLDPDKLVALGDASQFLTAQAILQLVNDHQLQLSTDINHFLPQGYQNRTPITIESLLTHLSGLPKIPNNFGKYEREKEDPYRYYSDTALWEFYRDYPLAQKVGKYRYSLVNYALLQYILKHFGRSLPTSQKACNLGFKEGKPLIFPMSFYQFTAAKGLQMTPNQLFELLKSAQVRVQDYPIYPTQLQKKIYSSYGFHVVKSRRHEVILLKGAVNGFTIVGAFDRKRDRFLLVVADAQDYTGRLYHALSWFF